MYVDLFRSCLRCFGGQYCEEVGFLWFIGFCDVGYYCIEGVLYWNLDNQLDIGGFCFFGYFCLVGLSFLFVCFGGKYNFLWKQSQCCVCFFGYFCLNVLINFIDCFEGYYCFNGLVFIVLCFKGSYKNYILGDKLEDCKICLVGMYCEFNGLFWFLGLCVGGWFCIGGLW